MNSRASFLLILGASVSALVCGACGSPQAPAPAAPAAPPVVSSVPPPVANVAPAAPGSAVAELPAPEKKPQPKFHHPALGMFFQDITEIGLRPDQQTAVDSVVADLAKFHDGAKDARSQLISDLANGVAGGKLDKAKLDADTKQLVTAEESGIKLVQDSLNKLHQTLDPEQRKKLVALWTAHAEKMAGHGMGDKDGPGKHGMGGKQHGPGDHGMGPQGPGGRPMGPHGPGPNPMLAKLGEELGLTAEQQGKLKTNLDALMKSHEAAMKGRQTAMQPRMKALADAFATDKFDAKQAGIGAKFADMVKMMTQHWVEFIGAVLSVLTPDQRGKFADHIRQHGEMGHPGEMGQH